MRTTARPNRGPTYVILIAVAGSVLSPIAPASAVDGNADAMWRAVPQIPPHHALAEPWIRPTAFEAFDLDPDALQQTLALAPLEFTVGVDDIKSIIALPMPDGTMARFLFVESPVMAPELAAKYPRIKTYLGQGIDDPMATLRFDSVPSGFHAQIRSPNGTVYIDPYTRGDTRLHVSYYKRDYVSPAQPFQCLTTEADAPRIARSSQSVLAFGETLRTYRTAIACSGEYTSFHGGTVEDGLAAIVVALNRVTGIYETDVAVRMELVANNDLIVYTDSETDPYSGSCGELLGQNQSNLDDVIGSAKYDLGHVFLVGSGGCAALGVICSNSKAAGQTGLTPPIGDPFYVDFVAHEIGHQFGASHTFNGTSGSCGGNRSGAHAYEPGSGTTIMAYAGICFFDNLQSNSDANFHSDSIDAIVNHTTFGSGAGCADLFSTGNRPPTVDAGLDYTIPSQTPFILTASGSDPDDDTVTYAWEERDLGPAQRVSQPDNGSSPLFRTWPPTTDPSRTFPRLPDLLNNTTSTGEQLPSTDRTMDFRVTVRDHRAGGGGVAYSEMTVTVTTSAGPFRVTSPNVNGPTIGDSVMVTWDVAGTDGSPVNVTGVNILLSTNGGNTFPITLASNTPNDGSELVLLSGIETDTGRFKVEAVGNIFFDVSDENLTIEMCIGAPLAECDDGDPCTANDVCVDGLCVGTEPTDCDDGNPCTDDSCNPQLGCVHAGNSGGPCDDGDVCTPDDQCADGTCVGQGTLDCADQNECTDDSCDSQSGCRNVDNAVTCDDQSLCTVDDRCTSGACTGTDNIYGDVNHDGQINLSDILCVLDAFQGDFSVCSLPDVDIAGCAPSGLIDLSDILAVLDAFEGTDPCCQ